MMTSVSTPSGSFRKSDLRGRKDCLLTQESSELRQHDDTSSARNIAESSIQILSSLESPANGNQSVSNFFAESPKNSKHQLHSLSAHKNRVQSAWMAVLASNLSKEQRKIILRSVTHSVVPWFMKPELLMDFLTDSYNIGGATSLLALSGLFYLMQEKNLDYPSFYSKLYSLLDDELLHSKHRSRFFRLLDTFMSSTHLPAALVASFIKRLSRLALHAPPGGIVIVIPWIYNMFKKHPQCTFMMHREPPTEEAKQEIEERGFKDPFSMEKTDPMETGAIDSSIWEIETLQSHYHPNVATLANIISKQFTKQSYNLEDFLDHSYNSVKISCLNTNTVLT
jgi:U3 small nucleolar RNA-associated protein 19